MLALLGGWKAYALAAILLVIGGLSVAVWGYRHKAAAAEARLDEIVGQRDRAIAAAKANEEAAKRLIQLNEALNAAIVERDKRAKALEEARRKIGKELDELKATLSAEDQDCLSRSLPDPLADLLRGGPGHRDPDRTPASPGSPASPVPNLEPQ
jgi:hypothetical protein